MSNVHLFKGATPPGAPDPDVVAKCAELLAMAQSGMLRGLAYGLVSGNNTITTGWVHAQGEGHRISTTILKLSHNFAAAWEDYSE